MQINKKILFSLMAQKGMDGGMLAEKAGLQRNTISRIITGRTQKITPLTAGKLAAALGVDVLELGTII